MLRELFTDMSNRNARPSLSTPASPGFAEQYDGQKPLRFQIGQDVEVRLSPRSRPGENIEMISVLTCDGGQWYPARVVAQCYHQDGWCPTFFCAYAVQVVGDVVDGQVLASAVREDDDRCIRLPKPRAHIANGGTGAKPALARRGKTCDVCGKHNKRIRRCSRCRSRFYCGQTCQTADWPKHKKNCARICARCNQPYTKASRGGCRVPHPRYLRQDAGAQFGPDGTRQMYHCKACGQNWTEVLDSTSTYTMHATSIYVPVFPCMSLSVHTCISSDTLTFGRRLTPSPRPRQPPTHTTTTTNPHTYRTSTDAPTHCIYRCRTPQVR